MGVSVFGTMDDGTPIRDVTLRSEAGAVLKVMEWGAVVRDLVVPSPRGPQRVVLGFPRFSDYPAHSSHCGAIAGRFANRIGGGRFVLDGAVYELPRNALGRHSIHGGGSGFGKRPWTLLHHDRASATFGLVSAAGDHGYPGSLHVSCCYRLAEPSTLHISLSTITDAPTVINLAHHSYFNLDGSPDILDHELEIRANLMTPVDDDMIPDGSLAHVSGTPFDFRVPRSVRLQAPDGARHGYDHNFMLRRDRTETDPVTGIEMAHAATLRSSVSGLAMEVWTSEPALQFYDGAKLSTPVPCLDGNPLAACAGLCLEPQHVPDSPNLPHFPTTILRPGEVYRQVSEYRFR